MSNISSLGFNGVYLDDTLDNYHLGNGYRAYNPAIMAFTAPDDMSPFGHGGINPYMYCSGDPINNTDATGHFNLLTFATGALLTGISAATVGGLVFTTVVSGGATSIPAIGAMLGSAYGVYAGIDQMVDAFHQSSNVTGEQWKSFGINVGITIAAELGGAALGAGIKALAPETSASIEGAIGRGFTRRIPPNTDQTVQEIELNQLPNTTNDSELNTTNVNPIMARNPKLQLNYAKRDKSLQSLEEYFERALQNSEANLSPRPNAVPNLNHTSERVSIHQEAPILDQRSSPSLVSNSTISNFTQSPSYEFDNSSVSQWSERSIRSNDNYFA